MSQRSRLTILFILETIAVVYFIAFLVSFDNAISMLKANADLVVPDYLRSAWQWIAIAGFSHLAAALLRLIWDTRAQNSQQPTTQPPQHPTPQP